MIKEADKVRVDKWLWAIRIYKTRAISKSACESGKVKIGGESVKPSRLLHADELLEIRLRQRILKIKVKKLIDKRVGAAVAIDCYEDLSPVDMNEIKLRSAFHQPDYRPKGAGRPTKKERRDIDKHRGERDD